MIRKDPKMCLSRPENAIPAEGGEYDDELDRKPINLDDSMDLTQAIADASRPRRKQSATPIRKPPHRLQARPSMAPARPRQPKHLLILLPPMRLRRRSKRGRQRSAATN